MKRTLSLWLGLAVAAVLSLALLPAHAQQAANTGKVHGQVINPTGQAQSSGSVSLSTDGGTTLKFTFPVDGAGNFTGEAPQGTYMIIYRAADTPAGQMVDSIRGVKVIAGQDIEQNLDMSRQEYIDKMTPDQRKQLEELKKNNAAALKANAVISQLNNDLKTVNQDQKDIDGAMATAEKTLGPTASKADLTAKVEEIKTAKYNEIVSLMTKDTGIKPDEALMWAELGYGQAGLKQFDDATTSYKKAVDLETASKKPRPAVIGQSQSGLGEIYARQGKVPDANTAFDAAAKANPAGAQLYLNNQAIIFFQQNNAQAQVAAADEAIKAAPNPNDPSLAVLYYVKGQGLVQNATIDPKTHRIVLPPDCTSAYQTYLQLAPNGQFAGEVTGILQQAGEKINTTFKAGKK